MKSGMSLVFYSPEVAFQDGVFIVSLSGSCGPMGVGFMS